MLEDVCIQGEYFDEAFFAHKEDIDLAWRSRISGWKAIYTPKATAIHAHTFRPGNRARIDPEIRMHAVKNRYFLILKNEGKCTWKRDWPAIIWYDLKILVYLLFREWPSLKAFSLLWQNRQRIRNWRKAIWDRVKVSDQEMREWFVDPE
jgi:GT2 family glycosyltransferase